MNPAEFRDALIQAGVGPEKPLYPVLVTVYGAAREAQQASTEVRKPWTRDEIRILIDQLDETLLHRWTQFNRSAIAIGVATTVIFGVMCGAGGWWSRGAVPALIGVRAETDQCQNRPDGSRLCWIPIFERLPPAASR
jgi:hypothetical protein